MTSIVEFLEARITEDERSANETTGWRLTQSLIASALHDGEATASEVVYANRLLPRRMLAECKAKRAIIAEHATLGGLCQRCVDAWDDMAEHLHAPCPTLLALAQLYAGHPQFNRAWAA